MIVKYFTNSIDCIGNILIFKKKKEKKKQSKNLLHVKFLYKLLLLVDIKTKIVEPVFIEIISNINI